MAAKISVKQSRSIDRPNGHVVTVTEFGKTETFNVWTNRQGNGLWQNGKQILGTSQFRGGKNISAAIRRHYKSISS